MTDDIRHPDESDPVKDPAPVTSEPHLLLDELRSLRKELEDSRQLHGDEVSRAKSERDRIEHSVRNTFSLIRSIFARTFENAASLEEVQNHFGARLDVLLRYQSRELAACHDVDLESLVRDELMAFQFGDLPGIKITGPQVLLPPWIVQPFALAVHELVTNALKFGALVIPGATLSIDWTAANHIFRFTWAEEGVPVVTPVPMREGFSREFIEEALPYQIGAETSFELRPGGVFCRIDVPLP